MWPRWRYFFAQIQFAYSQIESVIRIKVLLIVHSIIGIFGICSIGSACAWIGCHSCHGSICGSIGRSGLISSLVISGGIDGGCI